MSEIPLLSQDQIDLLQWLADQQEPPMLSQFSDAPGFTRERLVSLEKETLVDRLLDIAENQIVGRYKVNDRGQAVLLKLEQIRRQETEEKERRAQDRELADTQTAIARSQNRILIAQTIIALVSFIVGLFAEHYGRILDWLFRLFR